MFLVANLHLSPLMSPLVSPQLCLQVCRPFSPYRRRPSNRLVDLLPDRLSNRFRNLQRRPRGSPAQDRQSSPAADPLDGLRFNPLLILPSNPSVIRLLLLRCSLCHDPRLFRPFNRPVDLLCSLSLHLRQHPLDSRAVDPAFNPRCSPHVHPLVSPRLILRQVFPHLLPQ